MKKKADLSFNVIIVAIIAIIVLVVVIYIFSSKTGGVSETLNKCMISGGSCVESSSCNGLPDATLASACNKNGASGLVCCKGLIKTQKQT